MPWSFSPDVLRASVDDQENRARFTHQQPFDGNSIKTSAFTPPVGLTMNHMRPFEVIAEIRLIGMTGACGRDHRGFAFLAPGAPRVMIGADMSRITKIDVGALCLGHFLDLRVFRRQPFVHCSDLTSRSIARYAAFAR